MTQFDLEEDEINALSWEFNCLQVAAHNCDLPIDYTVKRYVTVTLTLNWIIQLPSYRFEALIPCHGDVVTQHANVPLVTSWS